MNGADLRLDERLHDRIVAQARLLARLVSTLRDDRVQLSGVATQLTERLFDGLECLHQATREPVPAARSDGTGRDPEAKRRAYRAQVDRIRSRIAEHLPPASIVAVVTRGDPSLVDLPGHTGWHFPQNELGVWAGFHPATGHDAVQHLVELCRRGARYFAVPATSAWWLEFYTELREHLAGCARQLVADADLALYELLPEPTEHVFDVRIARYDRHVAQFLELADALLPKGCLLLVV